MNSFNMTSSDDYRSLDTTERDEIHMAVLSCPRAYAMTIQLEEDDQGNLRLHGIHYLSETQERSYLDSGGTWNYRNSRYYENLIH